jgi:hypothetical protein
MSHALVFVLAPEAALPDDGASLEALVAAQQGGLRSGVALRIFRAPDRWADELEDLVGDGSADASGSDPFQGAPEAQGERRRLVCDAVVPHFEPRSHWLGVYSVSGEELAGESSHPFHSLPEPTVRCLDRFALRDAEYETCWFYPTEDGSYLGWENKRRLQALPGYLIERPFQETPPSYGREGVHVLWSLMADDLALTCVGLTYRGRRIEWPIQASQPEPFSTWTSFRVDSSAEHAYGELSSITVFPS